MQLPAADTAADVERVRSFVCEVLPISASVIVPITRGKRQIVVTGNITECHIVITGCGSQCPGDRTCEGIVNVPSARGG